MLRDSSPSNPYEVNLKEGPTFHRPRVVSPLYVLGALFCCVFAREVPLFFRIFSFVIAIASLPLVLFCNEQGRAKKTGCGTTRSLDVAAYCGLWMQLGFLVHNLAFESSNRFWLFALCPTTFPHTLVLLHALVTLVMLNKNAIATSTLDGPDPK